MKYSFTVLLLLFSYSLVADTKVLSFGVVPQQVSATLTKVWVPILKHISHETGLTIQFKTAPDIPRFEKKLAQTAYDIAYINPYHYVSFHGSTDYRAFAKQKDKNIQGIMVVHKDSDYTKLEQLQGSELVFPSPGAFAASILTRAYFKKNGIDITPKYVSSHDSVYYNVAKKLYPAGGGIHRTFNAIDASIRQQLKILWVSKPYTPHAFVARKTLLAEDINKIQTSLINLEQTEQGRLLLKSLKFSGIESAKDQDWNDIRTLKLNDLNMYLTND